MAGEPRHRRSRSAVGSCDSAWFRLPGVRAGASRWGNIPRQQDSRLTVSVSSARHVARLSSAETYCSADLPPTEQLGESVLVLQLPVKRGDGRYGAASFAHDSHGLGNIHGCRGPRGGGGRRQPAPCDRRLVGMADLVCCMPLGAVPLRGVGVPARIIRREGTSAGRIQRASEAAYA